MARTGKEGGRRWHPAAVRALRRHLGLTQQEMARLLGARQQTISEWERGMYAPRGTSSTLLNVVAERAAFLYEAGSRTEETGNEGRQ